VAVLEFVFVFFEVIFFFSVFFLFDDDSPRNKRKKLGCQFIQHTTDRTVRAHGWQTVNQVIKEVEGCRQQLDGVTGG
jgi:hypothetical protein